MSHDWLVLAKVFWKVLQKVCIVLNFSDKNIVTDTLLVFHFIIWLINFFILYFTKGLSVIQPLQVFSLSFHIHCKDYT